MVDQVEAVMDAAIKAARAKAKEEGLVEKGGDLKVVVNLAFSVPAQKRWLAFGSRIPAPCPVILRGSLRESADEAEASR